MLALPFLIVFLVFIWLGRASGRLALGCGFRRSSAALMFIVVAAFPWLDCFPGYWVFATWKKTHPAFSIHETVKTGSVYLLGADVVLLSHGHERDFTLEIRRSDSHYFGIRDPLDVPGKYLRITDAEPSDPRCTAQVGQRPANLRVDASPTKCVLATVESELQSEFAIEGPEECGAGRPVSHAISLGSPIRRRFNDSEVFPIYGSCTRVVSMKSGNVIAESWNGFYAPIVARNLTMLPSFESGPERSQVGALWSALVPTNTK